MVGSPRCSTTPVGEGGDPAHLDGAGPTVAAMPVTVDLPPATLRRLEAEAARRGVGIGAVIAELAEALPADDTTAEPRATRRRFALAGIGASSGDRFARDADELLPESFGRD